MSEAPLGLSKDKISQKVEKRYWTMEERKRRQLENYVEPMAPSCLLAERKSWMPNNLTPYARKQIIDGCYIVQEKYVPHCAAFFTGTLPRLGETAMYAIDLEWNEIVRLWQAKVSYWLNKGGLDNWIVHKTEFQSDGTPHIHAVFPAKSKKYHSWNLTKEKQRDLWADAVTARIGSKEKEKFAYSTRVESLHTSAMGYMCKYLTKEIFDTVLEGPTSIKQFWGMTNDLRQEIKNRTIIHESSYYNSKINQLAEKLDVNDPGLKVGTPSVTESHYATLPFYASANQRDRAMRIIKSELKGEDLWEPATQQTAYPQSRSTYVDT